MAIKEKGEEISERPEIKELEGKRAKVRSDLKDFEIRRAKLRADLISKFDKMGERRIIKAFPNLLDDLLDKIDKK